MSNSKKQKPAAWRMSTVAAPPANPQTPHPANAHDGTTATSHLAARPLVGGTDGITPALADAQARGAWRGPAPAVVAQDQSSGHELSSDTSLDDLFKAILGDQAGDVDDRALLLETVEAQVRGIRDELGLPEPVIEVPKPAPAPVAAQDTPVPDRTLGSFETDDSTAKRSTGLFRMVAGLALGRFSHS